MLWDEYPGSRWYCPHHELIAEEMEKRQSINKRNSVISTEYVGNGDKVEI